MTKCERPDSEHYAHYPLSHGRRPGSAPARARVSAHPREALSRTSPPPCHTYTVRGGNSTAFWRVTRTALCHTPHETDETRWCTL